MREKIAHILCEDAMQGFKTSSKELADQIHKEYMTWFREEIEKLKIMTEEEVNAECGDSRGYGIDNWLKELLEVQLTKSQEELEDLLKTLEGK